MGKYLTNFKTKEEYNSFKDSSNYIYPNISYIEDSRSVINKSPQTQEKQVEITENGEITITPDAGFAYLNSVKVKTNVTGSGGGVGYLYFENVPPMLEPLMFSSLINDGTRIIPSFLCGFNSQGKEENITVYKIAAMYGYTFDGMKITEDFLREFMSIGGIVEITEEEFYNLDNGGGSSLIEFTVEGTPYQAEEGMTWGEFVESEYNNGDFETVEWEIDEPIKFIYHKGRQLKIEGGDDIELLTNKINSNGVYYYNALG